MVQIGEETSFSSWATMCLDKECGGLGVKDLGQLNKALLPKCPFSGVGGLLQKGGFMACCYQGLVWGGGRWVVLL